MQNYSKPIALFILLAIIALLASRWQALFSMSAATYRSPLGEAYPPPGKVLPPQSERVVLVILSGLGDKLQQQLSMPVLEQLQESGASTTSISYPPSFRQAAWVSLISGASPSLNNASPLPQFHAAVRPATLDTIFHSARRRSIETALLGHHFWEELILPELVTRSVYSQFGDDQDDEKTMSRITKFIKDETVGLIVLQFNQLEYAAQTSENTTAEYQAAAQQIDAHLSQLMNLLDLKKTTLIITADYGLIEGGLRGGGDTAVIEQPFVMVGKQVIPGSYNSIRQVDIAPTVAVLLGLNLPSASQGRPLLEMLQLSKQDQATIVIALAEQRLKLVQAYLKAIDAPASNTANATKARSFLSDRNYAGAAQLGQLLVNQTDEAMRQAQSNRLGKERRRRFLIVISVLAALLLFMAKQRTELWLDALLSGAVVVTAYHILYRLGGLPYSLSAIANPRQTWSDTMWQMALSILVGSLFFLALLALRQYTNPVIVWRSSYELALFAVIGFITPALYGFWQVGPVVTWHFPDVAVLFYYLTSLWQTFWAAGIGLFTPMLVIPLNLLIQKGIVAYQHKQILKLKTRNKSGAKK